MTKLTVRKPATRIDLAEIGGTQTTLQWLVLKQMWTNGQTFTVLAGQERLALFGLYPLPGGGFEATFAALPGARRHMRAIVRLIRLTLSTGSYPAIVTLCVSDAGKRLARLAGFSFQARAEQGEVWGYEPIFRGRKLEQQRQFGGAETAAGNPAPATGAAKPATG